MGIGAEAFTIVAVMEAVNRISGVIDEIDASLDGFVATAERCAITAEEVGAKMDESLVLSASGVDTLDLANARLSAASERAAGAAQAQAEAERQLIEAQRQAFNASSEDAGATERLIAASDQLANAQRRVAAAAREMTAAEDHQAAVMQAQVLATAEGRARAQEAADAQAALATQEARAAEGASLASKAFKWGGLAVAAIGYESIKAAGNFENLTEHLVTDANEQQSKLQYVRGAMLQLGIETGTTATKMYQGMYHIEAAGLHGAKGIEALRAAAEGAKVGGADLDSVAKALAGSLDSYSAKGYSATQMMNGLIASVSVGDMKLQDLALALGNVAPTAAAAGIDFAQVGAALATMTAQNMSARQAAMDLNHAIGSLEKPNSVQLKQMQEMGVDANDLSQNLGKRGIAGTLEYLTKVVAAHTKNGQVLIDTYNRSKDAIRDADVMLKAMPPDLQKLGSELLKGTISYKDYNDAMKALPPLQRHLGLQFALTAQKTNEFNALLASGKPVAQTYNAAMANLLGGTVSLKTALMLTGGRMDTFKQNVETVSKAMSKGGKDVENWDKIQGTFNQKMDRLKASVEAVGISIGTALLPVVSAIAGAIADVLGPIAAWISAHHELIGLIAAIIGPMLAVKGLLIALNALMKLQEAILLILDAEWDANPIGLLVIALAALVGGLIYAYNHFKWFHNLVQTVFSALKIAATATIHAVVAAFDWLVSAAVAVWHGMQEAWNGVVAGVTWLWNGIVGIWDTIVNVTTSVWNGIKDFFAKWWPLLLVIFALPLAVLIGIWNHFHKQITDTVKSVWEGIKGFFVNMWRVITGNAKIAWDLFYKYIVTPVKAVWNWMQPAIHAGEQMLSAAWGYILKGASFIWGLIKSAIIKPISETWHELTSWLGKIASLMWNQMTGAWKTLTGILSKFWNFGVDIVKGIINGIMNQGSALFDSLKNLANSALNAAKSLLGINSPSKVFADHVGRAIPEGIAKGINDHAHLAHQAVRALSSNLATQTSIAMSSNIGASIGGLTPAVRTNIQGGVTVNVDLRNARPMSDRDLTDLVNKVGRAVAAQILPKGGVRLNM